MKKKLIKSLSLLALSAMVGVSAFSAVTHAGAVQCENCYRYTMGETERDVDISYVNPDEHLIEITITYGCSNCEEEYDETYSYTEGHDYELDEVGKRMICYGCYDSYAWH